MGFALLYLSYSSVKTRGSGFAKLHYPDKVSISKHSLPAFHSAILGSSDFGVINKIVKKQYDTPINSLEDSKIITTFSFL